MSSVSDSGAPQNGMRAFRPELPLGYFLTLVCYGPYTGHWLEKPPNGRFNFGAFVPRTLCSRPEFALRPQLFAIS